MQIEIDRFFVERYEARTKREGLVVDMDDVMANKDTLQRNKDNIIVKKDGLYISHDDWDLE